MGVTLKKRKKKSKPSGLRKYWPHLTLKECEVERQKLSDAQEGCCAVCGRPESDFSRRLAVDHSHVSGKVRGLLCFVCNKFLVGRHTVTSAYAVYQYLKGRDNEQH